MTLQRPQSSTSETLYEAGRSVDHYRVLRLIGRGGMGEVYLARDVRLGRKVALKVVRPDAMTSPDARSRFLFEARTTARFNHPHIVTIYDVGEHEGRPYVALEHLEGQSLRERLQAEQPGAGEALRIGRAIADALAEAHAHGIVHRDLKPSNVLLGEDGRLRVLDFGLARALASQALAAGSEAEAASGVSSDDSAEPTDTFESDGVGLRGTPAYMAPEQWRNEEITPAADIWALGVILCQLVYGAYPFKATSPMALRAQVLTPEAVALPETDSDVAAPLEGLIRECMAKIPGDRPDAQRVADRLAAMLHGERRPRSRRENPYRGLLPFDERHGDMFFGRDDEIAAFVERLRSEPVLPVVGPSGAGKSSFIQAGVVPRLREQGRWLLLKLRPGSQPIRNLAQRFIRGDTTVQLTPSRLAPSSSEGQGHPSKESPSERGGTPGGTSAQSPEGDTGALQATAPALGVSAPAGSGEVDAPSPDLALDKTVAAPGDPVSPPGLLETAPTIAAGAAAPVAPITSGEPTATTREGPRQGSAAQLFDSHQPEDLEDMETSLRESPTRLALLLSALAEREQARVLLFVDQLEELYTMTESEQERAAFMDAIANASDDPAGPVRVVFTLRDDFLGRLAAGDAARRALSRVTVLRSPGPDSLREILVRPLEGVGYRYEDDDLVEEMVAEVRGEPAALPLLQFAGESLWKQRDRQRKLLTREAYRSLGGVAGALAHHAESMLDGLSAGQVAAARQLMVRLVTSSGTRQVVSMAALLDGLGPEAANVLDRLIEARTVIRRKARSGEATETVCELVHESLILGWERLRRWVEESREEQIFLAEANQAAMLWERRGRRDAEVWEGDALREASRALSHVSGGVPELVREFIVAGQARQRRQVRGRRLAMATVLGSLVLVAVVLAFQKGEVTRQRNQARIAQRRAEHQKGRAEAGLRRARRNWAEALREGSGAALARGDLPEARARLRSSLELSDSPLARAIWLRLMGRSLHWKRSSMDGACEPVFTSDGLSLVSCAENNKAFYFVGVDTRRVTRILRSPQGSLVELALSGDGRYLAAGSPDGAIWLWDLAGGHPARLTGHTKSVMSLDFSPDSRWLASGSRDRTVRLWDMRTRKLRRVMRGHTAGVLAVRFAPNSAVLATAASLPDNSVRLWNPRTGKELRTLVGHTSAVPSLAWRPDGARLASGSYDRTIRVWDPASGRSLRVLRGHGAGILSLDYSPDGARLASGSNGDNVRIWNPTSGAVERTIEGHSGGVRGVRYHPTRPLLATKTISVLRVFDLSSRQSPHLASDDDKEQFFAAALTPTFSQVVLYTDRRLKLRDLKTGKLTPIETGHTKVIINMEVSRDGKIMASGANDDSVKLWSLPDGKLRGVLLGGQPYGLGFDQNAEHLITFSVAEPTARLWSLRDPSHPKLLGGHKGPVRSYAFTRDGKRLATGSFNGSIRLWDTATGRLLRPLKGHGSVVWMLAFGPRGEVLYSAGQDRKLRFWSTRTGKMLRERSGHRHGIQDMALSENGRWLITRSRRDLWLWSTRTGEGRQLGKLRTLRFVHAIISRQGNLVAASLSDGTIRVFGTSTRAVHTLRGYTDTTSALQFRRDGAQLAAIFQDGSVQLFDMATFRPLWRAVLLHRAGGELLTHRGWVPLASRGHPRTSKNTRWRRAVEISARMADETPDGAWLCAYTYGGHIQLWNLRTDKRIFDRAVADVANLRAVRQGCLVRIRKGGAQLHTRSTSPRLLAPRARAIGVSDDTGRPLVATDREALVLDLAGGIIRRLPVSGQVTAIAGHGSSLLLGRAGGSISMVDDAGKVSSPIFRDAPASQVLRIVHGPMGTVLAGFGSGDVAMWNPVSGRRLYRIRLQGPVAHLAVSGGYLHAASAQGDHRSLPLAAFNLGYCDLLRRVWTQLPIIWRGGAPVRHPPPRHHRCLNGNYPLHVPRRDESVDTPWVP